MVEGDLLRGAWIDPRASAMTFGAWAATWLGQPGKRPSAYARDEVIVRVHLLPTFGEWQIGAITPPDVHALVKRWARAVRPRTVKRHYGVLRAILGAAVTADVLARSPCRGVRLPTVETRAAACRRRRRAAAARGIARSRVRTDGVPRCSTRAPVGRVRGIACASRRVVARNADGFRTAHAWAAGRPRVRAAEVERRETDADHSGAAARHARRVAFAARDSLRLTATRSCFRHPRAVRSTTRTGAVACGRRRPRPRASRGSRSTTYDGRTRPRSCSTASI